MPFERGEIFSQRVFSIYTDIRKLQDKAKTSYTLTDSNNVLSKYNFKASISGVSFSVDGNKLTVSMDTAPSKEFTITATKKNAVRRGVVVWSEGKHGQNSSVQDVVSYTSFFTDDDGDLILPEAFKIGNYRIEEVSAPYGYVVNDKYVSISVDTDTAFETDGDTNDAIITVEYSDAPAVGELTVEKKGEVLDGFKGGLLASSYEKEFVYNEGSLAGAKFKFSFP